VRRQVVVCSPGAIPCGGSRGRHGRGAAAAQKRGVRQASGRV